MTHSRKFLETIFRDSHSKHKNYMIKSLDHINQIDKYPSYFGVKILGSEDY